MEHVQREKRLPHKGTYGALKKGNILPWKRAKGRISPSISTKEGVILLVTGPRQLASRKRQTLQGERISRSLDAELPARKLLANLHDSSTNLSQRRIESEAELNHHGDVHTPYTTKAVQSVSKSGLLQTFKNFEGGLVDT